MAKNYHSLFLLGNAHEHKIAESILNACVHAKPIPVIGKPLDQCIALLSKCAFTICNDSGLMNISEALGIRTYVITSTLISPASDAFCNEAQRKELWPNLRPVFPPGGIDPLLGAGKLATDDVAKKLIEDEVISK